MPDINLNIDSNQSEASELRRRTHFFLAGRVLLVLKSLVTAGRLHGEARGDQLT